MRVWGTRIAGFCVAALLGAGLAILPQYSALIFLLVLFPLLIIVGLQYPESLLAFFLTAGFYKTSIPLPIDVTILAAIALILLAALRLGKTGGVSVPTPVWGFVACSLLVLVGALQPAATAYGVDKALRLATLGSVSVFAPMILIRSERSLIRLAAWLLGVGAVMSVLAVLAGGDPLAGGRYTALGSNTIALGRVSAIALAVLAVTAVWNSRFRIPALAAAFLPALSLLGSGSRGPAIAVVLGLVVLLGVKMITTTTGRVRSVAVGAIFVLLVVAAVALAPSVALERFDLLFEGGGGHSGASRLILLGDSARMFSRDPIAGAGTGAFAFHHGALTYPHNIVMELASENGIFALIGMLVFVVGAFAASIGRVWRHPGFASDLLLVMIISAAVNALVSGDLNANRILYSFATIALVLVVPRRADQCPDDTPLPM